MIDYSVIDNLLRASVAPDNVANNELVAEGVSPFETELGLMFEGDEEALRAWRHAAGGSLIVGKDGSLPPWLAEGEWKDRAKKINPAADAARAAARAAALADPDRLQYTGGRIPPNPLTGKARRDPLPPKPREQEPYGKRSGEKVLLRSPEDVEKAAAKSRALGVPTDKGGGGGGEGSEAPSHPPSDDDKSAYHVPHLDPFGVAHRGKVKPVYDSPEKEAEARLRGKGVGPKLPRKKDEPKPEKGKEPRGRVDPQFFSTVARTMPGQTFSAKSHTVSQKYGEPTVAGATVRRGVPAVAPTGVPKRVGKFKPTQSDWRDKFIPDTVGAPASSTAKRPTDRQGRFNPFTGRGRSLHAAAFAKYPNVATPTTGFDPKRPFSKLHSTKALHQAMHTIAGISDDTAKLSDDQRDAIGLVVQTHGKHMGYEDPHAPERKGDPRKASIENVHAADRALDEFANTHYKSRSGVPVFRGLRDAARLYAAKPGFGDAEDVPGGVHGRLRALLSAAAQGGRGKHFQEVRRQKAKGVKVKPIEQEGEIEGTNVELSYKGHASGARESDHKTRVDRLDHIHELLGSQKTPEHAARLKNHFDLHDSKARLAHHNAQIDKLKKELHDEVLRSPNGSKEARRLANEIRVHSDHQSDEIERHNKAGRLPQHVDELIHKHTAKTAELMAENPNNVRLPARAHEAALLRRLRDAVHSPEGHNEYRDQMHGLHALLGGHEEYGVGANKARSADEMSYDDEAGVIRKNPNRPKVTRTKTPEAPAATESYVGSLYDLVFESDEGDAGDEGDEGDDAADAEHFDKPKGRTVKPKEPGDRIGHFGDFGPWKGKVGAAIGSKTVSRSMNKLFTGLDGANFVRHILKSNTSLKPLGPSGPKRAKHITTAIETGKPIDPEGRSRQTRTPRERGLFVQAALDKRVAGKGKPLGPEAETERQKELADKRHELGWGAVDGIEPARETEAEVRKRHARERRDAREAAEEKLRADAAASEKEATRTQQQQQALKRLHAKDKTTGIDDEPKQSFSAAVAKTADDDPEAAAAALYADGDESDDKKADRKASKKDSAEVIAARAARAAKYAIMTPEARRQMMASRAGRTPPTAPPGLTQSETLFGLVFAENTRSRAFRAAPSQQHESRSLFSVLTG